MVFLFDDPEPPVVANDTIEVVKVMVGETADMRCDVHSTPPPEISWEVENQPISISPSALVLPDNTLRLSRTKPTDAGYYTCTATNIVGTASKLYQLVILGELSLGFWNIKVKVLFFRLPQIPIKKRKRNGWHATLKERLELFVVHRESIVFFSVASVPPTIEPVDGEQVAYVDESVTLLCPHGGVPAPTVMWMKGEEKVNVNNRRKYVVGEDGSLTIYGLQDQDSAEYTCNVGNEAGIASATTELSVLSEYWQRILPSW